ncbi:unnamed protein product [Danaus chrysippus]|nr:unnamed protein product [Danaus chrysippus]
MTHYTQSVFRVSPASTLVGSARLLNTLPVRQSAMHDLKHAVNIDIILWAATEGAGYSCPYGQNCLYEPAPPGRAPACAQPGLTYCLHPDPYPEKVIRKLVEAGQYDIRTLLSDESRDNFQDNKKTTYPYGYGPNSLPHVDQISLVDEGHKDYNTKYHKYNQDIFSEKAPLQPPSAADPTPYNIKAYQAANYSKFGFQGYSSPTFWDPSINQFQYENRRLRENENLNLYNPNYFNGPLYQNYESNWLRASSGVTQYNPSEWWKYISPSRSNAEVSIQRSITFPTRTTTSRHDRRRRNTELVKAAEKRTLTGAEALRIALGLANEDSSAERPRRQASSGEELCRVRTQFINPRAALNNKGSWRYVVNMPDNMTQLVRAEICA